MYVFHVGFALSLSHKICIYLLYPCVFYLFLPFLVLYFIT